METKTIRATDSTKNEIITSYEAFGYSVSNMEVMKSLGDELLIISFERNEKMKNYEEMIKLESEYDFLIKERNILNNVKPNKLGITYKVALVLFIILGLICVIVGIASGIPALMVCLIIVGLLLVGLGVLVVLLKNNKIKQQNIEIENKKKKDIEKNEERIKELLTLAAKLL